MLFEKLLSSLFPKQMLQHPMNPISAFISYILPRQFFSIINRKVVENYKLNMFDISLESFDARVGFGESPFFKPKELEFDYYGYNVVANLNGYRFFSPGTIATVICFLDSIYTKSIFEKKSALQIEWLKSLYLLTFVFFSRVKIFPFLNDKDNFNWYMKLLNNFFAYRITQSGIKISSKEYEKLFAALAHQSDLQYFFYKIYFKLNQVFATQSFSDKDVYNWIFSADLRKNENKYLYDEWLHHSNISSKETFFSSNEMKILESIFPADILINYLCDKKNSAIFDIASSIYDKKEINILLENIWEDEKNTEDLLIYLTDYTKFRNNFFSGAKNFFSTQNETDDIQEIQQMQKQLDELADMIEKNGDLPEGVKIPEKFKNESIMFEKIVNFYVTFIGGFWIARGDNYYLRIFRKQKVQDFVSKYISESLKQDAMFFYGGIFYNYSKNLFFYKYVYEKVKAGQEKFTLPFRSTFRDVHANIYLIYLMSENFFINVLQDINPKDIKLNLQDENAIHYFKSDYAAALQNIIQSKNILQAVYSKIFYFCDLDMKIFSPEDEFNLKENLYCLDFWVWFELILNFKHKKINFLERYSVLSVVGLFSFFRETLLGFFILKNYFEEKNADKVELLMKVYLIDIIGITDEYMPLIGGLLSDILKKHKKLFESWSQIDENQQFLKLGLKSRNHFIKDKNENEIISSLSGEDINWLRGYLKTINFYNRRFVIPEI